MSHIIASGGGQQASERTFDLPFHREEEQRDEIHQQDRPKHGYVEDAEEGHHERDDEGFRERVPELELW